MYTMPITKVLKFVVVVKGSVLLVFYILQNGLIKLI